MGVDAMQKFRIHDGYRLEQARVPEDMRVAPRRQALATGAGYSNVTPPRYSPRSPISMRLRFDDRSIFVGNLPCSVNEQRIREHFSRFGLIHNVVLCLKQSSTDGKSTSPSTSKEVALICHSSGPHGLLLRRILHSERGRRCCSAGFEMVRWFPASHRA